MFTTLVALTLIPQQGQAYLRLLLFRGATPTKVGTPSCVPVPSIDNNIGQVVLQNERQKVITWTGNRPTVLVIVIHDQTACSGCVPEFAVVVGVASAAILNAVLHSSAKMGDFRMEAAQYN